MTWQMFIETITKWWTTWLLGIIGAAIVALWRKVVKDHKDDVKKDKSIENALMSILKDRIYQSCRYHLHEGAIGADELEILSTMFESYTNLGGNGVCKTLMEKVQHIKIDIQETH